MVSSIVMDSSDPDPPGPAVQKPANAIWADKALRSTLRFFLVPALVGVLIIGFGIKLPSWALQGVGIIVGLSLVNHTLQDPEWLLAAAVVYLPLNRLFVVPLGFGINGTNVVLLLLLFSWFRHGRASDQSLPDVRVPATRVVGAYAVVTVLSMATAVVTLGFDFVFDHLLDIKAWFDQFIVFFAFVRLIRDGEMARRIMVYVMMSTIIVLVLGVQEWLDKRGASSIEKARLLGPQLQPNDFGAFVAYASTPYLAMLLCNLRSLRAWLVTLPYLLTTARLLLATFSRGAYLGMGLAAVVAAYVRGKVFLAGAALLALALVMAVPEVVPTSLRARMSQTSSQSYEGEQLDKSAQTRLILWDAALKMTAESPVFGWGFKAFPRLKARYTDTHVEEADNHNMYLYLSSQMGIPAVALFVLILWRLYSMGTYVYRGSRESFARAIGMTGSGLAGAAFLVNFFGSRMVDICVTVHFWVILAVVARLSMEVDMQQATETS